MRRRFYALLGVVSGLLLGAAPAFAQITPTTQYRPAPSNGRVDDVTGDSISDVLGWVQDNVIENAPLLLAIFIALALFGFGIRVLVRATRYVFRKLGMLGRGV